MATSRRIAVTRAMLLALLLAGLACAVVAVRTIDRGSHGELPSRGEPGLGHPSRAGATKRQRLQPRQRLDASGFWPIVANAQPWNPTDSLAEIARSWNQPGLKLIPACESRLEAAMRRSDRNEAIRLMITKAMLLNGEGKPDLADGELQAARVLAKDDDRLNSQWLCTLLYFQGVTALRRGENDNCIDCLGEGSCILPIRSSALHTKESGSRAAIRHFSEMLAHYPDDLEVRWLLNVAHMTLGEYPQKVDPRFLIPLDHFRQSEFDIGQFRDVAHLVKVNRLNQAGSGLFEDLDGDGRLDLVVTSFDPTEPMAVYSNRGDGTFQDCTKRTGEETQLGGMFCVQTDYNNDGRPDLFIARGAWLPIPIRPTLLRNDGDWHFTDVTSAAGLSDPVNSNSATWADYDNDGWLDLFICCEIQPNRLYRNRGDGRFEEIAKQAGLHELARRASCCKGATWIDYDNDDFPDLFLNFRRGDAALFHNDRDGTFTDVSQSLAIDGPRQGFSCWAWDYDNDGWLDIFATCYDRTLGDVVKGLIGQPHNRASNRLFHNRGGKRFEDVTKGAGVDLVFAAMGSNFGDFDNDGFLDFYLGTGEPDIATLVPNRMFKNVAGLRFAEITGLSGTGHLQKGHGVSCGDWDRDGDLDLFVETGGVVNGDKYHNILFQNPGQGNHWLSVKLKGTITNRAAIGARIKVVTAGSRPLTVHRHVTSGSSFGANPLEQHIGLGRAEKVATVEVHWPTSRTTQVFRDIGVDQAIEIVEQNQSFHPRDYRPIALPAE
jgi:hypothetical protein